MKIKVIVVIALMVVCCGNAFGQAPRSRDYEKERNYWSSWPRTLSAEEMALLNVDFENKFNCFFLKPNLRRPGLMRPGVGSTSANSRTNTWVQGCGKSLIVFHGANNDFFQKIDPNGLIVACGLSENQTDLKELKWYEEEKEKRLVPLRSKWAKERGMSLEEAMQKYKAWQEKNRNSSVPPQLNRLLNSPNRPRHNASTPNNRPRSGQEIARARRTARLEAERKEAERHEREASAEERKAQRQLLMQLGEEVQRRREEREREAQSVK